MSELKNQYPDPVSKFRFFSAVALVVAASVIQLMSEGKFGFSLHLFFVANLVMMNRTELHRRMTKSDFIGVIVAFLLLGLLIALGRIPISKEVEQALRYANPFIAVVMGSLMCFAYYIRYKRSNPFVDCPPLPQQETMPNGGADDRPLSSDLNRLTSKALPPARDPQEW